MKELFLWFGIVTTCCATLANDATKKYIEHGFILSEQDYQNYQEAMTELSKCHKEIADDNIYERYECLQSKVDILKRKKLSKQVINKIKLKLSPLLLEYYVEKLNGCLANYALLEENYKPLSDNDDPLLQWFHENKK